MMMIRTKDLVAGDMVRVVEHGAPSDITYVIRKVKESGEGTKVYLLKSDGSPITLMYYEKDGSYLERI